MQAAEAESTLAQLLTLAERTDTLAVSYSGGLHFVNGHDLRVREQFVAGLNGISRAAHRDAAQARAQADQRQQELAASERSRVAAKDRAEACERKLAQSRQVPMIDARRPIGTDLE